MQSPHTTLHNILTKLHHLSTAQAQLTSPLSQTTRLPEQAKPYLLTLHVLFPHTLLPALDLLDRELVTRAVCNGGAGDGEDATIIEEVGGSGARGSGGGGGGEVVGYAVASLSTLQYHQQYERFTHSRFPYGSYGSYGTSPTSYGSYGGTHPQGDDFLDSTPTRTGVSIEERVGVGRTYKVSLTAWHCTCPAFAFSAYTSATPYSTSHSHTALDAPTARAACPPLEVEGLQNIEANTLGLGFGGLLLQTQALPPVCKHLLAVALGEWCGGLFCHGQGGAGMRTRVLEGWEEMAGWVVA